MKKLLKNLILGILAGFLLSACTLTFTQENKLPTITEATMTRLKYLQQAEKIRIQELINEQAIKDLDKTI